MGGGWHEVGLIARDASLVSAEDKLGQMRAFFRFYFQPLKDSQKDVLKSDDINIILILESDNIKQSSNTNQAVVKMLMSL